MSIICSPPQSRLQILLYFWGTLRSTLHSKPVQKSPRTHGHTFDLECIPALSKFLFCFPIVLGKKCGPIIVSFLPKSLRNLLVQKKGTCWKILKYTSWLLNEMGPVLFNLSKITHLLAILFVNYCMRLPFRHLLHFDLTYLVRKKAMNCKERGHGKFALSLVSRDFLGIQQSTRP